MSGVTELDVVFFHRYPEFKEILDIHERGHWIPDEADMRMDVEQWKNGSIVEEEKLFIKMILRLFTQADTDVCGAYVDKLLPIFKAGEVRAMLLSFAAREVTHILGYKRLNDTLGYDTETFMTEFLDYSQMKDKHDFMIEDCPLGTPSEKAFYLAKQVLMEGVNLFASFAMLLSFSQEGKLPGMVSVNKWSIADESHHVTGLSGLFKRYVDENPQIVNNHFKAEIYETARKVVAMEDTFVDLCFSVGKTNVVTPEAVKAYVRYVCDYRMQQLGLKPQFGVKDNPIEWIDKITESSLVNFFEISSVEYSKGNMSGEWVY